MPAVNRIRPFGKSLEFALGISALCIAGAMAGCAVRPETFAVEARPESVGPKRLFVFLDGTQNTGPSGTNVYRLFSMLPRDGRLPISAIYIPGVGSADRPIGGTFLGRGMEHRMLLGYRFLTENYHDGDQIYIFGFSRGAHQARALAGFISFAGLPEITAENKDQLLKIGNRMLELTKLRKETDVDWTKWTISRSPPLADEILHADGLKQRTRAAEIAFLGIWDTVPGSFFKSLEPGACRLPPTEHRERYKSGSYPPIRTIVHALSYDEKRSRFRPLLACQAVNGNQTQVHQAWFPGAHSDVGGGYGDPDGLPGISLNWMIGYLNETHGLGLPRVNASYSAPAHWSVGNFPGNFLSNCENRKIVVNEFTTVDNSVTERRGEGEAWLLLGKAKVKKQYPLMCSASGGKGIE
jgi:uncharacterized protein (DUF2235 family)